MENPTIQIAIAAHKPYRMPEDPVYLPIQVGAALHPEVDLGWQKDDEGDNISKENASYCELTALYWLWKNSEAEYKGLVHYRRHFGSVDVVRRKHADRFQRIATRNDFLQALHEAPVVLPERRKYYIESMRSHWDHTQPTEQLEAAERAVRKVAPQYAKNFTECLGKTSGHMFNMFVMRADYFEQYCSWLFPVLEEAKEILGDREYGEFQQRWPGRISELLLDSWMVTNGVDYTELPTVSPEPVDWLAKGRGFLAAKFFGKKYEKSF